MNGFFDCCPSIQPDKSWFPLDFQQPAETYLSTLGHPSSHFPNSWLPCFCLPMLLQMVGACLQRIRVLCFALCSWTWLLPPVTIYYCAFLPSPTVCYAPHPLVTIQTPTVASCLSFSHFYASWLIQTPNRNINAYLPPWESPGRTPSWHLPLHSPFPLPALSLWS